ncbi:lipocalin family protein [Aquiflexum balticum]|nr:lipocalin family protein [Aquiflexum balticum]
MSSCTEETPTVNDDSSALIKGEWILEDWYDSVPRDINNDGEASNNLFSQWNGCKKQSVLFLLDDRTGKIVYKGESNNPKCPPGFETNNFFRTGPWEYNEESQLLTFRGDDYLDSYSVIELSPNTLVLKGSGFLTCCDASISYFTGGYLKFRKE